MHTARHAVLAFLFPHVVCLGCPSTDVPTIAVSNHGPEGPSVSENSCAPADGWALLIRADSSGDGCGVVPSHEWRIDFVVYPAEFAPGSVISLGNTVDAEGTGRLWQDDETTDVVSGTLELDWFHDWADGVPFTGTYAVELADGRMIEGTLDGFHCGGDPMCG